jgi:GTP-binding protein
LHPANSGVLDSGAGGLSAESPIGDAALSCILKLDGSPRGRTHLLICHPAFLDRSMRFTTQFLLSAMAAAQFPAPDVPEIAFLGRSNVGKSSLLNALVGEKAAKVSSTPGRTRAINFFALLDPSQRRRLVFADLPGYGYAKISKSISAEWPKFIEPYLAEREALALGICLVDTNIPPQPSDKVLIDFFKQMQRPFLVVGTKADRLSNNALTKSLGSLKQAHGIDEVLAVSAKTGAGTKALWSRVMAIAE